MKKEKNLYSGFYFISGSININKNFAHDIENKINYVESVVISHNSDIHLIGLDICNNCFNLLIHSSYSYKLIKQIIFNDTEYYLKIIYPEAFVGSNSTMKMKCIRKISDHNELLNLASYIFKQNRLNIVA